MLGAPVRRCKSLAPSAYAEGVLSQYDPLFANGADLSHSRAVPADIGSPMTRRTRTSTTLCSRGTSSWALAEGVGIMAIEYID